MSNSTRSTSYDERYVVPLEASRRGAHRARVNPVMAALPVVAVAGIVVGAIALVYVVFGSLGSGSDSATPAATTPAGTAAGAAQSTAPAASQAEPSGDPTPTAGAATGAVDRTVQIAVFNGSGTTGLGLRGAEKLRGAGWTVGEPATWTGAAVKATTIFYATPAQKATAQAVLKSLGRGTLKQSPTRAGVGMTVVIGPDFPGATAATSTRSHAPTATQGATKPATTATPKTSAPAASGQPTAPETSPAG